jgi:hypothetical protein
LDGAAVSRSGQPGRPGREFLRQGARAGVARSGASIDSAPTNFSYCASSFASALKTASAS